MAFQFIKGWCCELFEHVKGTKGYIEDKSPTNMRDIIDRLTRYALMCCPPKWPENMTAQPSKTDDKISLITRGIDGLHLVIPASFFTLEVGEEAVKAFLSFEKPLAPAAGWDESSMTNGHVPIYAACIDGLAALVEPTDPAKATAEHPGRNNTRTDLLASWVGDKFVFEMKRSESGLASVWNGWPWSGLPGKKTEGTKSLLSQACHFKTLTVSFCSSFSGLEVCHRAAK
jgi:hypothetical protein